MIFGNGLQHNDESFKHAFIFCPNFPSSPNSFLAENVNKKTTTSS